VREVIGIVGISYLALDDEKLYREIIDIVADVCYRNTKFALEYVAENRPGFQFDFAHFWEDICFKTGPLVNPTVFREVCGPHYRRITDLCNEHGIDIVSLDCDGKIDELIPIWLENGVNTMFPIEVGTWEASIAPWRERYGRDIRGVGGMDKRVFAEDRAAVDAEVARLKPLVDLGGYIPCPDHRIAPDAEWDNVRYYCDTMRKAFG
jgi:uroporphyrinogen decarboxylase